MKYKEYAAALLLERLVQDSYPDKRPGAMKPLQWSILRYLKIVGDGAVDLATISKFIGKTTSPVSRAVSRLEAKGFLRKENVAGTPSVAISITEGGLKQLERDPMHRLAGLIADLDSADRNAFLFCVRGLATRNSAKGASGNANCPIS